MLCNLTCTSCKFEIILVNSPQNKSTRTEIYKRIEALWSGATFHPGREHYLYIVLWNRLFIQNVNVTLWVSLAAVLGTYRDAMRIQVDSLWCGATVNPWLQSIYSVVVDRER